MFAIESKTGSYPIKIWLESEKDLEASCLEQAHHLAELPFLHGWVCLMPDTHTGKGMPIGGVIAAKNVVIPNAVGVDIGCGMAYVKTSIPVSVLKETMTGSGNLVQGIVGDILRNIPVGFAHHKTVMPCYTLDKAMEEFSLYEEDGELLGQLEAGYFQIGTLGGGNHFIEYGEDGTSGEGWLTLHCGSRNLGVKVAGYWHNIAQNPKRAKYIGFLWGDALKGYLSDMVIAQAYALYNHQIIRDRIFAILRKLCKAKCVESIFTTHNYISVTDGRPILRKGAIDASEGRRVAIPFNMRDGIAICVGKGNEQWLSSAPHGAGRIMSRVQAKKQVALDEFRQTMSEVFSTSICEATLDESPMAYKPTEEILELIKPTVDIISMIKPKLNIKDNGE